MTRAVLRDDHINEETEKLRKLIKNKNITKDAIKVVLETIISDRQNHKRQPKPEAPLGGISLRAASRKYNITHPTLSVWVKKGYIPVLLRTKNELYIDEAKIKMIAAQYNQNPGQGKSTIKSIILSF